MEALFLKLAQDYGLVGVACIILFLLHKQAMKELKGIKSSNDTQNVLIENLTDKVSDLNVNYEKHALKLEHGDKEFGRVNEEIEKLREGQHDLRDHMHTLGQKVVRLQAKIEV